MAEAATGISGPLYRKIDGDYRMRWFYAADLWFPEREQLTTVGVVADLVVWIGSDKGEGSE